MVAVVRLPTVPSPGSWQAQPEPTEVSWRIIAPPEAALGTPCTIHMVINGPESKDSGYKGQYENISPNGRLFALCKEPPIYANSTGKSTLMGKPSNPNVP